MSFNGKKNRNEKCCYEVEKYFISLWESDQSMEMACVAIVESTLGLL